MADSVLQELRDIHSLKSRREKIKLIILSCLIGLITGFVVASYRILLEDISKYRSILTENLTITKIIIGIVIFIIIGCIVQKMLDDNPLIGGSGIPQVNALLQKKVNFRWFPELFCKFWGGILAIGAGMSMGREGPSIHLGALIGNGVQKLTNRPKIEEKYLVTCGASAGLAAAFNAPLSGAIFSLEELHKHFSSLLLICTLVASGVSTFVLRFMIGKEPTFNTSFIKVGTIPFMKTLIVTGIFCVVIVIFGKCFSYFLVWFSNKYSEIKINRYIKITVFMLMAYLICIFAKDVTGGGHELIERMFFENTTLKWLLILVVLKFFYTMICYSTGFPGGIFLPMLVIGALIGKIYGLVLFKYFGLPQEFMIHFMLLGMAAYFTTVVRAPITGTVLILEMTGNFSYLISLIAVSTVTYILTELLKMKPIYEELFERMIQKQKLNPKQLENNEDETSEYSEYEKDNTVISGTILEPNEKIVTLLFHVGVDSAFENKKIKDLKLPKKMLIVSIREGNKEFIPNGNTILKSGDQVVMITDAAMAEKYAHKLKEKGMEIT